MALVCVGGPGAVDRLDPRDIARGQAGAHPAVDRIHHHARIRALPARATNRLLVEHHAGEIVIAADVVGHRRVDGHVARSGVAGGGGV